MTENIAQVKNNRMITINKHSVKQHDFSSSMFHNSAGKKVILLSKTLQLFNRQLWQQTFYSFNSTRSLPSTNLWLGGNFRRLFGGSCRSHFILFFYDVYLGHVQTPLPGFNLGFRSDRKDMFRHFSLSFYIFLPIKGSTSFKSKESKLACSLF